MLRSQGDSLDKATSIVWSTGGKYRKQYSSTSCKTSNKRKLCLCLLQKVSIFFSVLNKIPGCFGSGIFSPPEDGTYYQKKNYVKIICIPAVLKISICGEPVFNFPSHCIISRGFGNFSKKDHFVSFFVPPLRMKIFQDIQTIIN